MAKRTRASRREYWQQILQRQQASGLSIQQFCQRESLATATFFAWKRKLGQARLAGQAPAVNFAPVRIVPEASAATTAGILEIVLPGDRRVLLHGPAGKTMLADVLAVLEA